ncbi:hypothetical protein HDE_06504 [Halotydeus destructor]|nr:hypothetical protein HDE_06504 [Halotydeus destructor]
MLVEFVEFGVGLLACKAVHWYTTKQIVVHRYENITQVVDSWRLKECESLSGVLKTKVKTTIGTDVFNAGRELDQVLLDHLNGWLYQNIQLAELQVQQQLRERKLKGSLDVANKKLEETANLLKVTTAAKVSECEAKVLEVRNELTLKNQDNLKKLTNYKNQNKGLLAKTNSLKAELERCSKSLNNLPQLTKKISALSQEKIRSDREISDLKLRITSLIDAHDKYILTKDEEVKNLTLKLSMMDSFMNSEKQTFSKQLSDMKASVSSKDSKLACVQNQLKQLKDNSQNLKVASDKLVFDLRKDLNKSRCQLAEACSLNDELAKDSHGRSCPVCLVPHFELESNGIQLLALTTCGHVLCSSCFEKQTAIKQVCPMCKKTFYMNQTIKLFF